MRSVSRFDCASSPLRLKALLAKPRRVFWTCLGVGVVVHLSLIRIGGVETAQKAAKPLTTHFIKRQPRLTKPLELRKRPQPRQRRIQRWMVSVRARASVRGREGGLQAAQALPSIAKPKAHINRIAGVGGIKVEPASLSASVVGTREPEQKIDLSLELLDIQSLDTGKYHALVIQDPEDKRNAKGFCRLAVVFSEAVSGRIYAHSGQTCFELFVRPVVRGLADAMNRHTEVNTDVFGHITLDDAELFKTPWVFFMAHFNFKLSDSELTGLGKYLRYGGFVFADTVAGPLYNGGFRAITESIKAALELEGIPKPAFQKLPPSHPVYHCYFDFDTPPVGGDAPVPQNRAASVPCLDYLEGYGCAWALGRHSEPESILRSLADLGYGER